MINFRQFALKPLSISLLAILTVASAYAHHSPAAFNVDEEMTVIGEIVKYSFRNPHVYMTVAVEQRDGSITEVEVEAGAGSVISPLGFTRDAVAIGDIVTVVGSPSKRRPERLMLGKELYKLDGSYYPLHIRSRSIYEESGEVATSLAGTWLASRESFYGYLGESREWPLSPKGRYAMDNIDPKATPQQNCVPLASPTLMLYPVANTITVSEDQIVFDIDWLGSQRTIYMDGREHPPSSERFQHGHSTGRWEGDVLLIDTTNYVENAMGLSLYLPGGEGKHLTERIEISAEGKSLSYSGVITDDEFLTEVVEWSGEWLYRPQMQHSNEECDLEVAHRFLDD